MTDYPFRLLCKRCNSYRFTTITQVVRPGMMFYTIQLRCGRCDIKVEVVEELFDNKDQENDSQRV